MFYVYALFIYTLFFYLFIYYFGGVYCLFRTAVTSAMFVCTARERRRERTLLYVQYVTVQYDSPIYYPSLPLPSPGSTLFIAGTELAHGEIIHHSTNKTQHNTTLLTHRSATAPHLSHREIRRGM